MKRLNKYAALNGLALSTYFVVLNPVSPLLHVISVRHKSMQTGEIYILWKRIYSHITLPFIWMV